MYEAKPTTSGTYDIFKDGVKQSTGSASILGNYGLSATQLKTSTPVTTTSMAPVVPQTPSVQTLPGIGTLTVTPKTPINSGVPVTEPNKLDNSAGLYERTGITPPPSYSVVGGDTLSGIAQKSGMSLQQLLQLNPDIKDPNKINVGQQINLGGGVSKSTTPEKKTVTTPSGAVIDAVTGAVVTPPPGLPSYPGSSSQSSTSSAMLDSYNALLKSMDDIETRIKSSAVPTEEEKALRQELADKKAQLANFDVGVEQRVNNMYGQGRLATLNTIGLKETQERRTSALERLGLATEAQSLVDQLSIATEDRKAMSDEAKTEYDLSTKRLDIALGVQKELQSMSEKSKDDARQYLLDVVSFASGKDYNDLDSATQSAIRDAVANSPITLDMVRTALSSAKDKAEMTAKGELRTVAGLGVVQIDPKTLKYKVIIPESDPGGKTFTQTQLNSGAVNAGVSLDVFKGFDEDTKNVFINGNLDASKKLIDKEVENGATAEELTKGINELGLPATVATFLNNYATQQVEANKPLTPEEQKTSVTQSMKDLQTQGYTRDEAEKAVRDTLTDNGKTTLPATLDDLISQSAVDVYGRTFWEKVLPGGK